MLTQTNAYQLANFQSTSGEVKKNAQAQIKEWEDTWDVNPKNPDFGAAAEGHWGCAG